MWEWLIALLAGLAAEPLAIERETPKAAAAVAVAYAPLADETPAK
jgi:hypothetical protein